MRHGASSRWWAHRRGRRARSVLIRSETRGRRLARTVRTVVGGLAPLMHVLEASYIVFSGLGPWWFRLGLRLVDCLPGSGFMGGARGGGSRRESLQGLRLVESLVVPAADGG